MLEPQIPKRTPMPSRPTMAPPTPPIGAKRVAVRQLSQSPFGLEGKKHRSKKVLLVISIILIGILIGVGILIAKTGVVRIPYLSSMYHERPLTRVVTAASVSPQMLMDRLNQAIQSTTSTKGGVVRVTFSEQEITGALKNALQTSLKRPGVSVDQSQIVVTPSGFEVTASIKNETMSVHVFARAMPVVQNGRLSFEITELYLGDIPVPPSSAKQIQRIAFGSEIGSWEAAAGNFHLSGVRPDNGYVELIFSTSTTPDLIHPQPLP